MNNSRKQILAQIAQTDELLQVQQNELAGHKKYLAQHKMLPYYLGAGVLLGSAFLIGWKSERKQWGSHVMQLIEEAGSWALLNYCKKMLSLFLRDNQEEDPRYS